MSARPVRAGNAYVEISTKSNVQQGLTKIEGQLKGLANSVQAVGRRMATMGAAGVAAAGAMLAPLGAAIVRFGSVGDELHKMAARTGASAETLSELGFAAEQSGASLEQVGSALFRMRRRLANATTETGPAVKALAELGLSAEEISRLSPDEQLGAIADAMKHVANESLAAQYAFDIFGGGAEALLPLLQEGSAGIAKLRQEARALGLTMSTEQAAAAAEYSDAMNRIKRSADGVTLAIGSALAPALTKALGAVTKWVVASSEWVRENQQLILEVTKGILVFGGLSAALVAVGFAIVGLGSLISSAASIFGLLSGAITVAGSVIASLVGGAAALASPLGLAAAAATALGAAMAYMAGKTWVESGRAGEAISNIGEAFRAVWEIAQRSIGGILDSLSTGDWSGAAEIATGGLKTAFLRVFAEIELAFAELMSEILFEFRTGLAQILQGLLGIKAAPGAAGPLENLTEQLRERDLAISQHRAQRRRGQAIVAGIELSGLTGQAAARRAAAQAGEPTEMTLGEIVAENQREVSAALRARHMEEMRQIDEVREAVEAARQAEAERWEAMTEDFRRGLQVSFGTAGGFGGAGLENLPQLMTGQQDTQAETNALLKQLIFIQRNAERYLRDIEPMAFT